MIGVVPGISFLMKCGDGVGDEIHVHDVNFIGGTKWQSFQSSKEDKSFHHVELRGLGMTTVAQHDAGTENGDLDVGQQFTNHVLAELLGARVGIVVGAFPINGAVFGNDFIAALTGDSDCADVTETAQSVIVMRAPRQLNHFQRAAQIHVQATLHRLAVQRRRTVDYGVSGMDQAIVVIPIQTKLRSREIAGEDADAGLQVLVEARKVEVQLHRIPQATGSFLRVLAAYEEVQAGTVAFQQIGRHVRANVAYRSGQEYRHVAPLVAVFIVSPSGGSSSFIAKVRGGRTSSGRPSISGYVHRRSAGM